MGWTITIVGVVVFLVGFIGGCLQSPGQHGNAWEVIAVTGAVLMAVGIIVIFVQPKKEK